MDFFKIAALISPLISALLVGLVTYNLKLKTTKINILYQNRISAFREIADKLTKFKNFCNGRIAYFQGNEFSPYYEAHTGTLHYRTEIADISTLNSIFLSKESKLSIENLINSMGMLCSVELASSKNDKELNIIGLYEKLLNETEECVETLYSELNS